MAAVSAAGYQDIRDYIQANWQYIEIRNAGAAGTGGAAVVRLPVSDARVDWIHTGGAQALQLRVVLTGSDADIAEPVTLRSSAIYKVASGGSALSAEVLAEGDATINAPADSVTITHTIEVPDIP
jgi:hypothetical protein